MTPAFGLHAPAPRHDSEISGPERGAKGLISVSDQAQNPEQKVLRVMLVDDHPATMYGLRLLLRSSERFTVCATASSGEEALSLIRAKEPDLVSLDLGLGEGLGNFELCSAMRQKRPQARIVVYTGYSSAAIAAQAMQAGALGVVAKSDAFNEILRALDLAARGKPYVSPAYLVDSANIADLSSRQRQVLQLLADGLNTEQIATALGIGKESVRTHITALLRKLDVHDRTQAVAVGLRNAVIR